MASPLLGVAGVNSLLFSANNYARKLVSPFGPNLSIGQVAVAGAMAGAVQRCAVCGSRGSVVRC